MASLPLPKLTETEYLAIERAGEFKSEFVGGEMYAMSGGTLRHSSLALNIAFELRLQLKSRKCRLFNSDARVRTPLSVSYFYPDLSVVCGEVQLYKDSNDILTNPTVIVEVLSPTTADYDHGTKFAHYRQIPSLKDYLLVHTNEILIEQYTRQPDGGSWLLSEYAGTEAEVRLASIDCSVKLQAIYEDAYPL